MEHWVVNHPKFTLSGTLLVLVISSIGLFKLKSEGFIVDDLPKNDKIYTDLKFFEKHFKGVMPLEITIHVPKEKERLGDKAWRQFVHKIIQKVSVLEDSLFVNPNFGKPTSLVDGLKFVYRARSGNDSLLNLDPEAWSLIKEGLLKQGLEPQPQDGIEGEEPIETFPAPKKDSIKNTGLNKILKSFIDSAKQEIRISVPMADVGTLKLNQLLKNVERQINTILDSSKTIYIDNTDAKQDSTKFEVVLTGSTVTFLEGSNFIIKGLKDSIIWAFVLIAISMMFLFKSVRILLCSLIPNVIPLIITAGVMGWVGVPLKPSTVLVFSMALGIAIDITIRFLVNYRQELPANNGNITETVTQTIRQTGLSIIYTSLVLIAGFVVFMFSNFGGTKALGWLTTLTLFVATVTNLVLLPVLLLIGKRIKLL
jgi:predicted RND superfamily exporter protein